MLNAMQPKHANKLMQNEYASKQYAIGIQPKYANMQPSIHNAMDYMAHTMLYELWHAQCN